jgi:putative 4-mercaptohistidine N1-methyltranferase
MVVAASCRTPMNPYETEKLVQEYLLFHYGRAEDVMPWSCGPRDGLDYPVRCVTECVDVTRLSPASRALDIGCAVGRSSFELARHCGEVIGIDYSERFIAAAQKIAANGSIDYQWVEEGLILRDGRAEVPPGVDASRVQFQHGDAHVLPGDLGQFDVALAANLVDRLAKPRVFLLQLSRLVKPGGQLILTSPYTWMLDYTPIEEWLGGFMDDGKERRTLEGLRSVLESDFALERVRDLPFLIREHARKFQWSVAQATVWRRR